MCINKSIKNKSDLGQRGSQLKQNLEDGSMCEMGNRRGKRVECGNKFALKYTVKTGWIQNKSLMRYFEINTREDDHKIGILNGKK